MFTTISPLGEHHFSLFHLALDHLCLDAKRLERAAQGERRESIAMARRQMRCWSPGDHVYEILTLGEEPPLRFEIRS